MEQQFTYNCQSCSFHTNFSSSWAKHIETELHKTGKRKTRSDKVFTGKCPHCDYTSTNNTPLKQHILNEHGDSNERKTKFKYYCEYCDYGTFAKPFYDNHLKTEKHINFIKFVN